MKKQHNLGKMRNTATKLRINLIKMKIISGGLKNRIFKNVSV